jgi:hypothetical protein
MKPIVVIERRRILSYIFMGALTFALLTGSIPLAYLFFFAMTSIDLEIDRRLRRFWRGRKSPARPD